jgi:hypothetical protein
MSILISSDGYKHLLMMLWEEGQGGIFEMHVPLVVIRFEIYY